MVEDLIAGATPGVMPTPSGRFLKGVLPAALAADWLASTWTRNAGMLSSSSVAAERVATSWLLDLLGLPPSAAVGFVTGGMMANFTCLAAGRDVVLRDVGWDVEADGLQGAPMVGAVVGEERHDTVDVALRYLGPGGARSHWMVVDDHGRLHAGLLAEVLSGLADVPTIVSLQAGKRTQRARSTRSPIWSRSLAPRAPGCTSTGRSGSGPRQRRRAGRRPASRRRIVGDGRPQDAERPV